MALKEFIKKDKINTADAPLPVPAMEKRPAVTQKATAKQPMAKEISAPGLPYEMPSDVPVGAVLGVAERNTLRALSALQIRYGQAGEAVPYLLMIRKTNPDDLEAARLLALAFMKLKRWEEAEVVLAQIDESNSQGEGDSWFTVLPLYRSIVSFKTRKFEQARKWLDRFRNRKRSNMS